MSIIRNSRHTMLLGLCFLAGCRAFDSSAPVTLPEASEIDVITVTQELGVIERGETRRIVDPAKIARFVQFINEHNEGWHVPWYTFPAGAYTVTVEKGDDIIAVFWSSSGSLGVGPSAGFIGGRAGDQDATDNRLIKLAEDDWQELAEILNIR